MGKALIVLACLIIGLLLGAEVKDAAPLAKTGADVIGTLWLNGLRMTVVPLVIALLIVGIVQTAAAAKAGKIAGVGVGLMIALLWLSAIVAAVMIPLLFNLFPMPADASEGLRAALGVAKPVGDVPSFGEFIKAIVPTNPINAAANDAILPLIVFTMAFAFAVVRLPDGKRLSILTLFEGVAEAMVMIVGWVLWLAPLGVFALAYGLGVTAGATAFAALAHYVAVLVTTGAVIWLASFVVAWIGGRQNPVRFFVAAIPAQSVAISTQSSLAAMPAMLSGLTGLGVRTGTSEIILPVAVALFRATGPAMNFGVALYIAYWLGMELSWTQIGFGIAAGAITTMGAVSLPGSISFISSIAPICLAMGVPIEPLGLLVAIETFPDIMRTLGNVTMDMAVTATIDARIDQPVDEPAQTADTVATS
jgi:proton glutamate symport protein